MRKLNPDECKALQEILLEAFPRKADLEKMVSFALGKRLDRIAGGETTDDLVYNLVQWAESHNQTAVLVQRAHEVNPDKEELRDFAAKLAASPDGSTRPLADKERDLHRMYLNELAADIANRLEVSIHHARLVDIGVVDAKSTHLPWRYRAPDTEQEFASFDAAFTHYKRRVLLLGAPGAGKSTVLLHIADQLIQAANEPDAPLPLLLNLTQFQADGRQSRRGWPWQRPQLSTPDQPADRVIEQWLGQIMAEKYPFLPVEITQRWVAEDRVAPLLDGLDEVDDQQRAMLVHLLNQTYLNHHPFITVVVCSRSHEYQLLRSQGQARLHLAAVELLPLKEAQINDYLDKAQASGLRAALPTHDALYELAQTPLTLSMMTLAYGGVAPDEIPTGLSLPEYRRQLFDLYVDRMMQRKARRDSDIPFDLDPGRDQPTQYTREQVNRYLGWLAVRLSERMQTVLPLARLYSFLSRKPATVQNDYTWQAIHSTNAVLIVLCTLMVGLFLMPARLSNLGLLILTAGGAALTYWAACYLFSEGSRKSTNNDTTANVYRKWAIAVNVVVSVSLIGLSIVTIGTLVMTLTIILPMAIDPVLLGVIIISFCLFAIAVLDKAINNKNPYRCIVITARSIVLPIGLAMLIGFDWLWIALAVAMASAQALYYYLPVLNLLRKTAAPYPEALRMLYSILIILAVTIGLLLIEVLGIVVVATPDWYDAILTISLLLLIVILRKIGIAVLLGVTVTALLGSMAGGVLGALLATVTTELLVGWRLWVTLLTDFDRVISTSSVSLAQRIEHLTEKFVSNPILFIVLAMGRVMPFRYKAFFTYAIQTLLLRPVGHEYEFIHRHLRDHFATRELIARLGKGDLGNRLQAIRQLAFQGEAAVDVLSDLATNADISIRQAVVAGLGRIATPEAVHVMELALDDPVTDVRRAVVSSLGQLITVDKNKLIRKALDDPDLTVRLAAVAVNTKFQPYDLFFSIAELKEVTKILRHGDTNVRIAAALVLSHIGNASVVPDLLEALRGSGPEVRGPIEQALLRLANGSVVPALLKASRDSEWRVKWAAEKVLERLANIGVVVPVLIMGLRNSNSNPNMRAAMARTLGQADASVVPDLLDALQDRSTTVRSAAAHALGQVGDASAVPALIQRLDDRGGVMTKEEGQIIERVSDCAAAALERIGTPEALTAVAQWRQRKQRTLTDRILAWLSVKNN